MSRGVLSAQQLYDRAVALSNVGRLATARRLLDRAIDRTADSENPLRARILGTTAYIVSETGSPADALALCREALALPGLDAQTVAVLLGQQGLVELRRGDLDVALRLLSRSLEGLDATGGPGRADAELTASILTNRGICHLELGALAEAASDFAASAALFGEVGLLTDAAKSQHNQGYVALLTGDLAEALRLMEAARPLASAASPVDAAIGDVDRAEVLLAAGLPDEAAAALSAAIRTFGARRMRQQQADAEWMLARTLLYSDPARAARGARLAARRYRDRGNISAALRAESLALRARVATGSHPPAAVGTLDELASALKRQHLVDEARTAWLTAARVQVQRGALHDAGLRLAGIRLAPQTPIVTRSLAREVRVELAVARGDRTAARRAAADGLAELEDWQNRFGSLDLQSSLTMHGQKLTRAGIALALETGDAATVFAWSERARHLADRAASARPPRDTAIADALTRLRQLRLEGELSAGSRMLEKTLRERVRLHGLAAPGASAHSAKPHRADLGEVQRGLAGTADVLVSYVWSGESFAAVVVTATDARLVPLGPGVFDPASAASLKADLDMHAARLPGPIGRAVASALDTRLGALSQQLLDPVLEAAGLGPVGPGVDPAARPGVPAAVARLVITVPGILVGIPWSMLPGLAGRSFCVPTSVTEWVRRAPATSRRAGLAAGFVAGPGVSRADEEVGLAASRWPASAVECRSGAEATSAAAAALAERVDVLHLVGHGRHATDNPSFSGLELFDGPWFGYDVEQLSSVPGTVVLSSCELGRSAVHWGREGLGMARTWLHAGARSVIASATSVNDDDACALLPAVHGLLATGTAPADALARATAATGIHTPFAVAGAGW